MMIMYMHEVPSRHVACSNSRQYFYPLLTVAFRVYSKEFVPYLDVIHDDMLN
jgi:hypothetical protein